MSENNIQSANLTAGKGFSFENQVGAWFLVHMLAGVPPLNETAGTLQQLAFQTEPEGWRLDDLLLTCKLHDTLHHCAISIKSNRQFTAKKAPQDFVERCWQQFLETENNPFAPETDRLINIVSTLSDTTKNSLFPLLAAAKVRESAEMVKQLGNGDLSANSRAMFNSFACPPDLASLHHIGADKIGALLKCVDVLTLNLEESHSFDKANALGLCRQILSNGDLEIAAQLWDALVILVDTHRVDRGHIDLPVVLRALRHRFLLKDHPDYAPDWQRLWRDSKERWQSIIDVIGGKTRFSRIPLLQAIEAKFADHHVIVLLGEQGGGKSVAARHWAEYRQPTMPVLWLDSKLLESRDLLGLQERLKLNYPLQELVNGFASPRMTMILDGLDRLLLQPESLKTAGQLLTALLDSGQDKPFQILPTCQEQAWGDVQVALFQAALPVTAWPEIYVEPVSSDELSTLVADFPALRSLTDQDRLIPILRQPKILDVLARNSSVTKLPDLRAWVGESDVIDWIWKAEIESKKPTTARQRLMWQLAEKQAEQFSVDVPLDQLGDVADIALDGLKDDLICQSQEGRVAFSHDLWGDWSRQRLLLAHARELPAYLQKRLDNPTWHRATVLLGLDLLERQANPKRWLELMESNQTEPADGTLFCDLFLEALIRAAQTTNALAQSWEHLCTQEGFWLRRLLTRFLYIATSPNPLMFFFAKANTGLTETWAASINRRPIPALWEPMLRFLIAHKQQCVKLAPLQIAEIANSWLCLTDANMPFREEAADLALAVAWQTLQEQQHWRLRHYPIRRHSRGDLETIAKKAYSAALQAVAERPDEVIDFALCACGRRKPTDAPPPEAELEQPEFERPPLPPEFEAALNFVPPWRELEIEIPPWPDGPKWPVADDFRKVCLHELSLLKLIILKPKIAAEIILALIIREGGKRNPEIDFSRLNYHFEICHDFEWSPAFYDKGPFLHLLTAHHTIGLDVIIRLVNFITERWLEYQKWRKENDNCQSEWLPRENIIFDVRIPFDNGEQVWIGDGRWFFVYREMPPYAPKILFSVLMALEKWFYDLLGKGQEIVPLISDILKRTRSLALAGLLVVVGKKQPEIFMDSLLPFLSIPEVYRFDLNHQIGGEQHQMIDWGMNHSQQQVKAAKQWHSLPHRTKWLEHIVLELLFKYPDFRQSMDNIRIKWQERLSSENNSDSEDDLLFRLYHQFNLNNWRCELDAENNIRFEFQVPEEMLERNRAEQQLYEDRQGIMYFPIRCRQIIDGEQELPESEFESFDQQATRFLDLDFDAIFERKLLVSKQDITCGLIAVVVCKFKAQLDSENGQENCINLLVEIINNPPPRRAFDVAEAVGHAGWDSFCADALPILWVDNQNDPAIRQAIALLAFSFHHETVKRLFKQFADRRSQLGDDYPRLHHLLLRWSVLRYRADVLNGQLFGHESATLKELQAEANTLIRQFMDASLSPDILQWRTLEHSFTDRRPSLCEPKQKYHPRSPCLDLQIICSAYDWLPTLDAAQNEAERKHWLSFWQQAVETLCWMLGEGSPEIEAIDGTPYQFDRWLFQKLPPIMVSTQSSEEAASLWKPILQLGAPAHDWLESFLNDWWLYGFSDNTKKQRHFLAIWKEIWTFTRTRPEWSNTSNRYWHMDDCQCALMGLGDLPLGYFWDADKSNVVLALTEEFRDWCENWLSETTCARAFTRFLLNPVTKSLQLDGIKWLDQTFTHHGFWHDSYKDIDKKLADLLDHCQYLIKQDADFQDAFFRLLRVLVERQNPQAMVLQEKLGAI